MDIKKQRFCQMRRTAKYDGKYCPSYQQLENLYLALDDFKCPACNLKMVWKRSESKILNISLQHDIDGKIRLICVSCNSKYGIGNTHIVIPSGKYSCRKCGSEKALTDFNKSTQTSFGRSSWCKACQKLASDNWKIKKYGSTAAYYSHYDKNLRNQKILAA